MSSRTRYIVVSWVEQQRRNRGRYPATREYGIASTKQAAIRLAERVLPPDADYIVTTATRTVHHGRTPSAELGDRERSLRGRSR
jgi:hypothetical protein